MAQHSAARMLCLCTPPGQEEFFLAIGEPDDSRIAPPPKLDEEQQKAKMKLAKELSAKYRTELLG